MLRLVLVDSTRAGKRIPDAFSKTVPIWCAVINRAVARVSPSTVPDDWDIGLYTPPQVVSTQEHAQIEARLDGWANALVVRPLIVIVTNALLISGFCTGVVL
jgi:tRNA A64-2'-O-ribosylphosphate transferase